MGEFEIIQQFFKTQPPDGGVELGIGDDCAIVNVPDQHQLIVTSDTLVENVHFPPNSDAESVAYRSCATALSDIAAMGGTARWASLTLTVPNYSEDWFIGFVAGMERALAYDQTRLIGGDLTQGPLTIGWHISGTVAQGAAMCRDGSQKGDTIFVTGTLGGAAGALSRLGSEDIPQSLLDAYWSPQPRLEIGRAIQSQASSCIDISDGFLGDLMHLLSASGNAAVLDLENIPISVGLKNLAARDQLSFALNGGDDYELCFTAKKKFVHELRKVGKQYGVPITAVGEILAAHPQGPIFTSSGEPLLPKSYQHFK